MLVKKSFGVLVSFKRLEIIKSEYIPHSVLLFWCCLSFTRYLKFIPISFPCFIIFLANLFISLDGGSPVLSKKKMNCCLMLMKRDIQCEPDK